MLLFLNIYGSVQNTHSLPDPPLFFLYIQEHLMKTLIRETWRVLTQIQSLKQTNPNLEKNIFLFVFSFSFFPKMELTHFPQK